ncbi:non-homologous end joining protein Ku [Bdellovibrio svalbardensis]|uniref:Non-homologous end joining protein Ku n=1 Tax=Bdellovibrio svalbardensis TaxID=2972972 RepID=A0ABT6DIU5_9BACT|nr:Ku protein [Bdellovibrio svalbardensis]MDG0816696.1 Ku protein [Bdellovibrio svalbardensis]
MRSNIWKGSISFGLLNIPVTLQTADQEKEIHFSMLDKKDLSRINYKKFNAQTGKEVPYDRIVKGFEYEKGHYVIVNDTDFRKANPKATQTIDIEDFVLLSDVDPLLFERPYYLAPQKGAEKGYYLLREALKRSKKVAIAKIVIRVKQHLVMLMPREDYIVLEILRFAHQVKETSEVDYLKEANKKVSFTPRELKMAEELIEGMTAKWNPEKYKDTYYQDMMKLIKQKVRQGQGHIVEEVQKEPRIESTSNIIDLMPLLKKSLAASKPKTVKKKTASRAHA